LGYAEVCCNGLKLLETMVAMSWKMGGFGVSRFW
jgi:hypothetical protein